MCNKPENYVFELDNSMRITCEQGGDFEIAVNRDGQDYLVYLSNKDISVLSQMAGHTTGSYSK